MNTHCKSIIYCIAYEHTCIIPHFAAEAHPPVFVMLTGRMRKDKKQKDAAEQQALLFYTHTHTHMQGHAVIFLLRSFGGASTSHSSTHIRVELTCVATTQPAAFAHQCVCVCEL